MKFNNEIDFTFVNEALQSSKYIKVIFNNLYIDHRTMCMRVSSDPNDELHLASS